MTDLYPNAVVVGRFQPLTKAHEELIEGALKSAKRVLVVIGSAHEAITLKNPFTYEQRAALIGERFMQEVKEGRLYIRGLQDYTYRNKIWYEKFDQIVKDVFGARAAIYACGKDDATQAYIDGFSNHYDRIWHKPSNLMVNATNVRNLFFRDVNPLHIGDISANTKAFLINYKTYIPDYERLAKELKAVDEYHKLWASAPFPPHFVAVDGLVVWKDHWKKPHILVIRRGNEFGNGKLALPGGYLEVEETLYQSAVREVREETGLVLDDGVGATLKEVRVFDDPNRSLRGRMLTHVHEFHIYDAKRPVVTGGDDASEAFWLPIDEVYRNKQNFFSDHYPIIAQFFPTVESFD